LRIEYLALFGDAGWGVGVVVVVVVRGVVGSKLVVESMQLN
jgi:hypothetical protein